MLSHGVGAVAVRRPILRNHLYLQSRHAYYLVSSRRDSDSRLIELLKNIPAHLTFEGSNARIRHKKPHSHFYPVVGKPPIYLRFQFRRLYYITALKFVQRALA